MNATHSPVVPFPSEWISWHSLVFPKGRQWRSALPFALEDKLASDVQNLCVIPVTNNQEGMGRVAVVSQQDLSSFNKLNTQSHAVWTPDFMRLPWQDGQVSLWVESTSRWVLRWGEWEGTAGHPQIIQTLLQTLSEGHTPLIMVYGDIDDDQLPKDATILRHALEDLPPLKPLFNINPNATGRELSWSSLGKWKSSVALFSIILAVSGLNSVLTSWKQLNATHAYQEQTKALLNSHFPEIKRLVNPIAQAKAVAKDRLALQAQLQSSPLVALSRIDAQLVNAPAVSQVKLTAGRIELSWNSPLADAVLSRSITLAGWQAQWLNPQQLLLTVQGDQP